MLSPRVKLLKGIKLFETISEEDIEDAALRTVTTFRTKLYRAEVCGLETQSLPPEDADSGNADSAIPPSVWRDIIGRSSGGGGVRRTFMYR